MQLIGLMRSLRHKQWGRMKNILHLVNRSQCVYFCLGMCKNVAISLCYMHTNDPIRSLTNYRAKERYKHKQNNKG